MSIIQKLLEINLFFFNVGHGDSTLIELITEEYEHKYILIDTNIIFNSNQDISHPAIDFLDQKHINRIDYLILSHLHRDHYSGIDKLLKYKTIDKIIVPKILFDNKIKKILFEAINNDNLKKHDIRFKGIIKLIQYLNREPNKFITDNEIHIFNNMYSNFEMLFLNTENEYLGEFDDKSFEQELLYDSKWHNYSIIGYFTFNQYKVLFPGDACINKVVDVLKIKKGTINILKAPHHGNIHNDSIYILENIIYKESYVIVTGDGSNNEVLIERLKNKKVICLCTNKSNFCVKHFKKNTTCHNIIKFNINKDIITNLNCEILKGR